MHTHAAASLIRQPEVLIIGQVADAEAVVATHHRFIEGEACRCISVCPASFFGRERRLVQDDALHEMTLGEAEGHIQIPVIGLQDPARIGEFLKDVIEQPFHVSAAAVFPADGHPFQEAEGDGTAIQGELPLREHAHGDDLIPAAQHAAVLRVVHAAEVKRSALWRLFCEAVEPQRVQLVFLFWFGRGDLPTAEDSGIFLCDADRMHVALGLDQRRQAHVILAVDQRHCRIGDLQIVFQDGDIQPADIAVSLFHMDVQHVWGSVRNDGEGLHAAVDGDDPAIQGKLFGMLQQKADALFFFLDAEDVIMTVLPFAQQREDIVEIIPAQPVKCPSAFIFLQKGIVVVAALLHLLSFQRLLLGAGIDVVLAIPPDVEYDLILEMLGQPVAPFAAQAGHARGDAVLAAICQHGADGFHAVFLRAEWHVPVSLIFCFDVKADERKMRMHFEIERIGILPHQHRDDVGVAVFISGQRYPGLQLMHIVDREFFHSYLPCRFPYYIRCWPDDKRSARAVSNAGEMSVRTKAAKWSALSGMPSFIHFSSMAMHPEETKV